MASFETPFSSEIEARETYYDSGDGGSNGGGNGGNAADWGPLTFVADLAGGWVLETQSRSDGSQSRFFVSDGSRVINSAGEAVSFSQDQDLDSIPSHATEQDARDAHAVWLENNGEEDEEGGSPPPWEEATEVPPWFVYARQVRPDTAEYCIAGVIDGQNVYLAPNAKIQQSRHVYTRIEAVDRALRAYFEAVENGDIPEEDRPTGQPPAPDSIPTGKGGGTSGLGGIMATIRKNPVLAVGAVAVGGYALTRNGGSS